MHAMRERQTWLGARRRFGGLAILGADGPGRRLQTVSGTTK